MSEVLNDATRDWFALLDGKQPDAALDLFCTAIIPEILNGLRVRFAADYPAHKHQGRYAGVISLLGYTPDTSILSALFTEANDLILLHTAETAQFVAAVRTYAGTPARNVLAIPFDRAEPDDLERAFDEARALIPDAGRVAVEVTGGTKPMGTTLHVLAALADMDTLYIDYERYDPKYRKPLPDSIHMRLLESPLRRGGGAQDSRASAIADWAAGRFKRQLAGL